MIPTPKSALLSPVMKELKQQQFLILQIFLRDFLKNNYDHCWKQIYNTEEIDII